MHFTLRQLEAFAAASEFQSFTKTADHLHLTPSAVSQLVIELEATLGYKLFERHTRKVALSPAGRAFLPAVESVLRDLAHAKASAIDIRDQAAGIIRMAAPMVVAGNILPALMAKYKAAHPKVVMRLLDCPVERLVDMVRSGTADLAVGPDRPTVAEVERVTLFPSPWVVWCSPKHRLARKRVVAWEDLAKEELVVAGRDHELHLAHIMIGLPDTRRFAPVQVVENISTALGMAAANLCYTLAPAYVSAMALPLGLVMKAVERPVALRQMSLFRSSEPGTSPAARGFGEAVIRALQQGR